jgi:hypothetical protein
MIGNYSPVPPGKLGLAYDSTEAFSVSLGSRLF